MRLARAMLGNAVLPTKGMVAYAFAAAVVICLAVPHLALAYVDPSVVTYAVQAIAGVAVAISAVVGVALRKVRKRIFDLFGIDPEAKKEHDEDFYTFDQIDDSALGMTTEEALDHAGVWRSQRTGTGARSANRRRHAREPEKQLEQPWPMKIGMALIVALFTVGTLCVVAPIEIVAGSSSDFFFEPIEIAEAFLPTSFVIIAVVAGVLLLFRGRAFLYALAVVMAVGLGFYVQAMFLNTGLPVADGSTVNWATFDDRAITSTIVWTLLVVGCVLLVHYKREIAQMALPALALALVVVQGVGVGAVLTGSDFVDAEPESNRILATEAGLCEVSAKKNVIVFVLDTFDTTYLIDTLEEFPDALDGFTGFTWYRNTTGSMIPTRYGMPFLLTGEMPKKSDTWEQFLRERWLRSDFLYDLRDAGYSVGLYTNDTHWEFLEDDAVREDLKDCTVNMAYARDIAEMDTEAAFPALVGCALYRDLPWILKPRWRFTTSDVKNAMLDTTDEYVPELIAYGYNDAKYFDRLKHDGLTAKKDDYKGYVRVIHLFGSHYPPTLDENGLRVEESTTTRQSAGNLHIVQYYINLLKGQGLYDNATIIVTADHGKYYVTDHKDIKETTTPIILVKPAQDAEEAEEPLEISDAPVAHGDIVVSIIDAIGGKTSKYKGVSLFDDLDEELDWDRPRYYLATQESKLDYKDRRAVEWKIVGNALDFDNWEKTGFAFDADTRYLEDDGDEESEEQTKE